MLLENLYETASLFGMGLGAGVIVMYMLCWPVQWAVAWMDDSKAGRKNWLILTLSRWKGYTPTEGSGWYKTPEGKDSEGILPFFQLLTTLLFLPLALVFTAKNYLEVGVVVVLVIISHVIRFSRRLSKQMKAHLEEKTVCSKTEK